MVQAARKYNRVVQAGTMQRSGGYFKKAAEIVQSGVLGEVTFCHTWQTGSGQERRLGQSSRWRRCPPDWIGICGWARRRKCRSISNRWGVA